MELIMKITKTSLRILLLLTSTQINAGTMGESETGWDGLYLSGQLGGAWANQDWKYTNPNYFNTVGARLLGTDFSFQNSNIAGGGNLGFNYLMDNWLLGIEGALTATNLKPVINSPFFPTDKYKSEVKALGTLKGRLGYAMDDWLFNINGGGAWVDTSLTLLDPQAGIKASSSNQWKSGWVAGLGVDKKIISNLSVGLGYDYSKVSVNNQTLSCPLCGTGVGLGAPAVKGNLKIQTLMARCSYLFSL